MCFGNFVVTFCKIPSTKTKSEFELGGVSDKVYAVVVIAYSKKVARLVRAWFNAIDIQLIASRTCRSCIVHRTPRCSVIAYVS